MSRLRPPPPPTHPCCHPKHVAFWREESPWRREAAHDAQTPTPNTEIPALIVFTIRPFVFQMKRNSRKKKKKGEIVGAVAASHLSPTVVRKLFVTWVEQDNGSKTPQFRLIHLHVPHLRHQFCEHPAEKQHTQTHTHIRSHVCLIGTFMQLESLWKPTQAGVRR